MEIFRAEKICVVDDNSSRTCRNCGKKMQLVRTVVDANSGAITHMFECACGKRLWDD
jgi:transposase